MRVLYVNRTVAVSGGERLLLGILGPLPERVRSLVASPRASL